MKVKKRNEDAVSFQLAPMIDMTFLLLVFFMVTTRISKETLKMDIKLPIASSAEIPTDVSNRDIINIDGDGNYFLGDRQVDKKEVSEYLKRRFEVNPPLQLYVRADLATPGRQMKEIMRLAAEAGAINVIFASHRTD
ncbi:MAG: ExbD/TolR family protein [Verrucomicrobiales bacterium]